MDFVENCLKPLILEELSFTVDGKLLKQGKLKVFQTKQCFLKFKLEVENETKEWELPYPYKIRQTKDGLLFDYCLSAFCPRTEDVYWKMFLMDKKDSSKLHNNYLYISK